uniref:Uncharacterized protein n=1 Tax=Nymphaea colorata TaxID=210225 RepID=A0A5K0V8T3_9MAGN
MPRVHQSTALPWPSPEMISGARYSWVPTNDMERTSAGSATTSGTDFLVERFFQRRMGWKQETAGTMQPGSMHEVAGKRLGSGPNLGPEEESESRKVAEVGASHLRERSKSVSIM